MLKTDPGLTTELPVWLVVCAAVFLLARIGLFVYEHEHPPVPSDEIHWQQIDDNSVSKKDSNKLILYYFTTNWSASVRKLESNAFSNKDIVEFVNDNFIPKRILDMSVEEHTNGAQIQKLEDKYGLSAVKVFPKLIVTLPDGTEVTRSIGARNSVLILKYLEDAKKTAGFVEAKMVMKDENWEKAADLYDHYLKDNGLKADRSVFAVLREYLCLKLMGEKDQAETLMKTDYEGVDPSRWPYPVLAYLHNSIDEKELSKRAGDAQDKRTQMHAYVGTALYLKGDMVSAEKHLRQSVADVHFKEWLEYDLANSMLRHIEKEKAVDTK